MGRKKVKTIPGLRFCGGVWHIEKRVSGTRLFESTGTDDLKEAQRRLVFRLDQIRQAEIYGVRPRRTFEEAAVKYLAENKHKRSIEADRSYIDQIMPYIGKCELDMINMGCLQPFIEARRGEGVKNKTINNTLQVVRRILNLASKEWVDESNLTWGHKSYRITTHYSPVEIRHLIEMANRVCERRSSTPTLSFIRDHRAAKPFVMAEKIPAKMSQNPMGWDADSGKIPAVKI